jgi:hypothetical protein
MISHLVSISRFLITSLKNYFIIGTYFIHNDPKDFSLFVTSLPSLFLFHGLLLSLLLYAYSVFVFIVPFFDIFYMENARFKTLISLYLKLESAGEIYTIVPDKIILLDASTLLDFQGLTWHDPWPFAHPYYDFIILLLISLEQVRKEHSQILGNNSFTSLLLCPYNLPTTLVLGSECSHSSLMDMSCIPSLLTPFHKCSIPFLPAILSFVFEHCHLNINLT